MKQLRTTLLSTVLISWLGGALAVGCGDDDDGDGASGGKGGQSGGAASGGAAGKGGSSSGGGSSGGSTGGSGGAGGDPAGGGSDGSAGSAGTAGAGGGPGFGAITEVSSEVHGSASDLRGLSFSKDGSKLYASGHIGVDPALEDRKLVVARFSADGAPDATFGDGGFVTLNLVPRELDIVADPDPSAAGAGGLGGSSAEGGAGGGGTAGGAGGSGGGTHEVVVNDGNEQSLGIVVLSSGQLIVQANVRDSSGKGQDVVLVKLDEDGALVSGFGTGGVQRVDFGWTPADTWPGTTGPTDDSWGIALDESGAAEKIVLFGHGPAKAGSMTGTPPVPRTDNDRYIARLLANTGQLDPAFNGGSVFALNTGGIFSDGGRRGIVEPDGTIVSAGYTNYGDGLGNHIVVIKLKPNGTPDPAFGFGIPLPGVARTNPFLDDGGVAECYGVTRQSSGRYVTTGYGRATAANGSSKYGWATTDAVDLVTFGLLDDALDTTFGRQGTLAIQSEEANLGNTEDRGRDLLALPDDRLVLVGRFGPNPAIFVTLPDGEFDTSVGDGGKFAYPPATAAGAHFYKVALSPDGTRIAASTSNDVDGARLVVLRVETP